MTRKKAKEKQLMESLHLTNEKSIDERPDIGRPAIFESKKDKAKRRNSRLAQKEKRLNFESY